MKQHWNVPYMADITDPASRFVIAELLMSFETTVDDIQGDAESPTCEAMQDAYADLSDIASALLNAWFGTVVRMDGLSELEQLLEAAQAAILEV